MTAELNGKRILVTGGATGIGAAAVSVLSAAGARVAATSTLLVDLTFWFMRQACGIPVCPARSASTTSIT